ncbi:MAG: hypothetical protein Ct9H300mP22_2900 [Gammaproteobacteria bacterium]|nr:MAG: hypothetical protein Ct9H300mP22_2900 [Gammaproteobacteria bacterium]
MMSEESQKESQIKDEQTSAILATSTHNNLLRCVLVFPDPVGTRIVGTSVRVSRLVRE